MAVDRYQTCLICATISLAIFLNHKMLVAKLKVAQNRHVCDHNDRKLSYIVILYSLRYAENKNYNDFSVQLF